MKLSFVYFGSGLTGYGFRKIASASQEIFPDVSVYFVATGNMYSIKSMLFGQHGSGGSRGLQEKDFRELSRALGDSDLIGFSAMSAEAELIEGTIAALREDGSKAHIVWGGVHPTVDPESCIQNPGVDAVCVGEGLPSFIDYLRRLKEGNDPNTSPGMWFRNGEEITRNSPAPLMPSQDMDRLPHTFFGDAHSEFIYHSSVGHFRPIARDDFLSFHGLSYSTIWTLGCPFRCTYCGVNRYQAINNDYGISRYSSVDYLMDEVLWTLEKNPHLNTVIFEDDSFLSLPVEVLSEFAAKWKERVNLPFVVGGVIPAYVDRAKIEILLDAGMNRLRMGIQSGSPRTLKFFKRPNRPDLIQDATKIIGDYAKYMVPPAYDFIIDNPVETADDILDTLDLVYDMPRPFNLNIFSLRTIPNTELVKQMEDRSLNIADVSERNFFAITPTLSNILMFLLPVFRPPAWMYRYLRNRVKTIDDGAGLYPMTLFLVRALYFVRRGFNQIWFLDFSVLPGKTGYLLSRIGLLRFWRKHIVKHYVLQDNESPAEISQAQAGPDPHKLYTADGDLATMPSAAPDQGPFLPGAIPSRGIDESRPRG